MIGELIRAVFTVGLPIALLSFALVWWALRHGMLDLQDDVDGLKKEIEQFGKRQKGKEKQKVNPVHGKWLQFGGGFYGVVALYTYALAEFGEVADFISNLGDLVLRLDIGVLIEFFINSFLNFIPAITWPVQWLSENESRYAWIWFVVAYVGYWIGMTAAQAYIKNASGE